MSTTTHTIAEARADIRRSPELYAEGFELLDRKWSQEAIDLRQQGELDFDRQVMGDAYADDPRRDSRMGGTPLRRMMMAVTHYKGLGPDLDALELAHAQAICCLDFLMVDPVTEKGGKRLCDFQSIPFGGADEDAFGEHEGGRSSIHGLLADDQWRTLVLAAHARLLACERPLPPLTEHARQMKDIIDAAAPDGVQASEIRAKFKLKHGQDVSVDTIKGPLRTELRPFGIANKAGAGYYFQRNRGGEGVGSR